MVLHLDVTTSNDSFSLESETVSNSPHCSRFGRVETQTTNIYQHSDFESSVLQIDLLAILKKNLNRTTLCYIL